MATRLLAALLLILFAPSALAGEEAYRIIVHPELGIASVERTFLRDAFLKKRTRWPGGGDELIRPVDHDPDSAARRKFSQDILGRSVPAVKSYWQQVIFTGRDVPPPELDTEALIVSYVQSHPGAVGYVSGKADVTGVKVVAVK